MSPHTQLALAVLGAVLTAAAAAYYAWWRGRELHREMDDVLAHVKRFETHLLGDQDDPRDSGELGRQSRNLERLRLIVEHLEPRPAPRPQPDGLQPGDLAHVHEPQGGAYIAEVLAHVGDDYEVRDANDTRRLVPAALVNPYTEPPPEPAAPPTARMPVVAALIPTTGPATGPADIPATDADGDPPDQPWARAYSLTGPRPRPPGAHRPPKEREA